MINIETGWEEGKQHWNGSLMLAHYGLDRVLTWWPEKGGAADVKIKMHETPLTLAIRQGHESIVRLLLSRADIDVNHRIREPDGDCPPLSLAIEKGHESIVCLLLSRPEVDIDYTFSTCDYDDFPPLAQAIFEKHESIVRLLLSETDVDVNHIVSDPDPDDDDYSLRPPLLMAIKRDLPGIVRLLLGTLVTNVNWRDPESNKTALHFAILDGHRGAEIVEAVISREDLEADAQTADGNTALFLAVEAGRPDIVRLLLTRKDVNVNHLDTRFESALSCATNLGQTYLVWYCTQPPNVSYQEGAFEYSNRMEDNVRETIIELLLAQPGINVNLSDINGYYPLQYAVFHGQSGVVKKLLELGGVQVDIEGGRMVSTRRTMLLESYKASSRFLGSHLGYSAADRKWFPLCHAALYSLAQFSEHSDAKVGLEDAADESPLVIAAKQGHAEIVKILLGHMDVKFDAHCLDLQDVMSEKYFEERKKRSFSIPDEVVVEEIQKLLRDHLELGCSSPIPPIPK